MRKRSEQFDGKHGNHGNNDGFAAFEEIAYGAPSSQRGSMELSPEAATFRQLYNYYTDPTVMPSSRFSTSFLRPAYGPGPGVGPGPRPGPKLGTAPSIASAPTPGPGPSLRPRPGPSTGAIPKQTTTSTSENHTKRLVRQENLMKLWLVHSIMNEKPDLLVDCEPSTSEGTGGLTAAPPGAPPRMLCSFCQKNGELPIVFEGHNLKDAHGRVSCPILKKHKCELCAATGELAHTRKHCPRYTTEKRAKLPAFRLLANGAMSLSHNHK